MADVLEGKYVQLGFRISKFGKQSLALKRQDKVVFVFGGDLSVGREFVTKLCDCHLKMYP